MHTCMDTCVSTCECIYQLGLEEGFGHHRARVTGSCGPLVVVPGPDPGPLEV